MVYLGQVLHYMQRHVGAFPDGGSGICLPWKATQKFASLLEERVHQYAGGDQATGLPESCQMLPGHFDDVVTGLCFQIMDLLPHGTTAHHGDVERQLCQLEFFSPLASPISM